jgi:DNA-binding transcriptional LysR family regulator
MDLRSLAYFVEVAETQNFSRAATRLNRTQPALSRGIQQLESELGVKLFERSGKRVVVTSNGKALLNQARLVLEQANALGQKAELLAAGKTGVLRIGSTVNFIERVLPELLRRYRARWPDVEVMLEHEGASALLAAVENGDIDVAVTRHVTGRVHAALPVFPIFVMAILPRTHALCRKKSLVVGDLEGQRLLAAPPTSTSRMLFDAACVRANVRPRIAFETHGLNALVALAEVDQGIAILPSSAGIHGHAVVARPILDGGRPLGSWTSLIWDKRRSLPGYAQDFVRQAADFLRHHYPGKESGIAPPPRP